MENIKIIFYLKNNTITTEIDTNKICSEKDEDGKYSYIVNDGVNEPAEVKFSSVDELLFLIQQGILDTLEDFNKNNSSSGTIAINNNIVQIMEIEAIEFALVPVTSPENIVTVEF